LKARFRSLLQILSTPTFRFGWNWADGILADVSIKRQTIIQCVSGPRFSARLFFIGINGEAGPRSAPCSLLGGRDAGSRNGYRHPRIPPSFARSFPIQRNADRCVGRRVSPCTILRIVMRNLNTSQAVHSGNSAVRMFRGHSVLVRITHLDQRRQLHRS